MQKGQQVIRSRHYLAKWKTEYDYKTLVTAAGSLAVTVIFALYNGFIGIYYSSLWHGAICVYYLILVLLRGLILAVVKRTSPHAQEARSRTYLTVSTLLLLLNISLVVPVSMMVRMQKPVSITLAPAIALFWMKKQLMRLVRICLTGLTLLVLRLMTLR